MMTENRLSGISQRPGRGSAIRVLAAALLCSAGVNAEVEESFGILGGLPEGWTAVYSGDAGDAAFSPPEIVHIPGTGNALRLARPGAPSRSAGVFFTADTFQNVSGSVLVRFETDRLDRAAVLLRARTQAYQPSGYAVILRNSPAEGEEFFQLGIVDAAETGSSSRGLFGEWADLGRHRFAVDTDYEIRFEIDGDRISAEVWLAGARPERLGSVTFRDSSFVAAGHIGLRHNSGNTRTAVLFRDFRLTAPSAPHAP